MECAKTIDELYEEVKGFDLVITNDAALATALNGRVNKPLIGPFAVTPKMIAGMVAPDVLKRPMLRDLRVISNVAEDTGYDFRYVHSEIENIKEIRRHTMEVDKYLYTKSGHRVYEYFSYEPTQTKVMSEFDIDKHHFYDQFDSIAVIGGDLFDDLDKHFTPRLGEFEEIELFNYKKDDYHIDTIYEVGNDREIADNAVELIDPKKAEDYAIVVNTASPLTDAVRSALYRRNIPFINDLAVRDLAQIRDYLQFLTLSMSYRTLRVKHVRELFQSYNASFKPKKDEFLLSKQLEGELYPNTRKLIELMAHIQDYTFKDVINELGHAGKVQVNMLIEDMNLADRLVTPELVSDLTYAVNNISDLHHNEEIPENEKSGVLITDCMNSVYIDRPVVLYLGLEQDWNVDVVGKPYIDAESETEKNVLRMKILLQQGSKRAYLVNTTKNGDRARPSLTFDHILGKPVETFDELCTELVRGRWTTPVEEIVHDRGEFQIDPGYEFKSPFSKSTFNNYITCPRKFMFGKLINTPENKDSEFGNLLHEFAELYVCYPDLVREKGIENLAGMISAEYSGLSSPLMETLDTDKILVAMKNIVRFIDCTGIPKGNTDRTIEPDYDNRFFQKLGLTRSSTMCETDETSVDHPMHGRMDLYYDGKIVDYKTGRAHVGSEIVKSMDPERNPSYYEFQPLIYLALARQKSGSKGEFNLFYAMDNDLESLDEDFDVRRNLRRIYLKKGSLVDCVADNRDIRERSKDSSSSKRFAKDIIDHSDTIIDIFKRMAQDDPDTWKNDEGMVNTIMSECGLTTKASRKSVVAALGKLRSTVSNGMVYTDNEIQIPEETLDNFLKMLDACHETAMEQSRTDLPAMTTTDCRDCDFFYACTRDKVHIDDDDEEGSE